MVDGHDSFKKFVVNIITEVCLLTYITITKKCMSHDKCQVWIESHVLSVLGEILCGSKFDTMWDDLI